MTTAPHFDQLLPHHADPAKEAMRSTLVTILDSKGEVLPSANSPRGKLWHLVNTPDCSLTDCAEIIQLDSALAARVLRVANSGAYGSGCDSVNDAVMRLGLKFVREQVYNIGVFKQFSGWVLPPEWDAFWLRNIFVARLCERLASDYGSTNGTEYLAGLLHDMGWLFLASYFPNEFNQLFSSGLNIVDSEVQFLPFSHAQISAALAARSLLPERTVAAISLHHFPILVGGPSSGAPEASPYFLAVVLNLSDSIADACKLDMFGQSGATLDVLHEVPAAQWLSRFRGTPDLIRVADEELASSRQIFDAYFSNRNFN